MSITINGKVFRNLEEQVQYNSKRIAEHYAIDRALANFGIKIVGSVANSSQLPGQVKGTPFPQAPDYRGAFGDAYVVGTAPPYTYWIYTRPDLNQGYTYNYWLDVGEISVAGPEGKPGVQGPQGPAGISPKIIFGATAPTNQVTNKGDIYVINQGPNLGYTYQYDGSQWIYQGDFKGVQGIQGIRGLQGERGIQGPTGPQGKAGTPGPAFYIAGIYADVSDLAGYVPTDRNAGYLIGTGVPYTLYLYINDLWTPVSDNFVSVQGEPGAQGPQGVQGPQGERGLTGADGYAIYTYNGELDSSMLGAAVVYTPGLIVRGMLAIKEGDLLLDRKSRLFKITSTSGDECVFTGAQIEVPGAKPAVSYYWSEKQYRMYGSIVLPVPLGTALEDIEKIEILYTTVFDESSYQTYKQNENVVIFDNGQPINGVKLNLFTPQAGSQTVEYNTYWSDYDAGFFIDIYSYSGGYFTFSEFQGAMIKITAKQ